MFFVKSIYCIIFSKICCTMFSIFSVLNQEIFLTFKWYALNQNLPPFAPDNFYLPLYDQSSFKQRVQQLSSRYRFNVPCPAPKAEGCFVITGS